ncbi:MAG: DUF4342 domain-containing protein [Bacillota bacterium]|nr:DUF4342 domain-containing protein [Bacillota bacterium]
MEEVTLEKIDIIRERTNATYTEAKEALEACGGNVVDALIYIEKNKESTTEKLYTSKEEFVTWLKDLIRKGNITRIKVKKEEKTILDIPVNAGVAAGVFGIVMPSIFAPLFAVGVITALVTKVTVEITKSDGSVEVVNKVIRDTVDNMKEKVTDVKEKFNKDKNDQEENGVYKYTVKFEDIDENTDTQGANADNNNEKSL